MADPIDFRAAYLSRMIEERVHHKDCNGDVWFSYCFEYDFLDKTFGINLFARNKDEAIALCESVRSSLRLMGEVIEEIDA
jgi:hypothetical protein